MDIVLVNPYNRESQFGGVSEYATIAQPLGLAMLAAVLQGAGYAVKIIDAEVENMSSAEVVRSIVELNPKAVGITAFTTKMTAAGEILRMIQAVRPDIFTIIGGHHPSAIPQRTLVDEAVNFVVQGEGYIPILSIMKSIVEGTAQKGAREIIKAPQLSDINLLPLPAWDMLPMTKYRAHHWQTWGIGHKNSFALVYTSLGCPFGCKFCSVNVVYGKRGVRYMEPKRVLDYFDDLFRRGIIHLEIIDDTFTLNDKRVIEICDGIIERGYTFNMWAFARTDRVSPEMLNKMKRAGINWVFMGIEAGNEFILDSVFKKQNLGQIKHAVNLIHEAGINIGGNYIFGLPDDSYKTMNDTLELALELNLEWSNFFVSMAYPGTALYNESTAPKRWEQYGFFAPSAVPVANAKLSGLDILKFRDKAFQIYFSNPAYQSMIERKFGLPVKMYVQEMLKKKINRDYEKDNYKG